MINGRFVCLGSTPYLKNKYGDGYKITVQKGENYQGNVDNEMLQICANINKVANASEQYETYQVI